METPAAATEFTVASYELYFDPAEFTIPANTDVVISSPNNGVLPHNFSVTSHKNPGVAVLGIDVDLAPGEVASVTINAPASDCYFFCNVPGHERAGMFGVMHVV